MTHFAANFRQFVRLSTYLPRFFAFGLILLFAMGVQAGVAASVVQVASSAVGMPSLAGYPALSWQSVKYEASHAS